MSKNVKKQSAISLRNFQAKRFMLIAGSSDKLPKDLEISVRQAVVQKKEDKRSFIIVFEILIENKQEGFELDCIVEFDFETNKNISKTLLDSTFIKQSAPAIAFPYVRSMISSLTINAGYDPLILPTFNFIDS